MAEKEHGGYIHAAIPKYNGHYDHWGMLMENLLRSKEYWEIVEQGIPVLATNTIAEEQKAAHEAKLKELKAKNYLFQALDRNILETILKIDTAKDILEYLRQKFQGSSKVKKAQLQVLRSDFDALQIKEEESVNEYFSRTLAIANKMKAHGEKMSETVVVEKIMRSMNPKFNYVMCSIVQANDIEKLSIDDLQSSILVEEGCMKPQKEDEQVLKITDSGKFGGRGRGKGRGRGRSSGGRGRGRGRQTSKEHIECYRCHKMGHYRNECPNLDDKEANYAGFEDEEEVLLMASIGEERNHNSQDNEEEVILMGYAK